MQFDRRLFNLLSNVRVILILTIVSGLLTAFFIIAQAWLLSKAIDGVFLKNQTLDSVLPLLLFFGIFSLLRALFQWYQNSCANKLAAFVKKTLRDKITSHLTHLGPAYLKSERSGEISNTLLNGVETLEAYFSQFIPQMFLSALIPLAILIFVMPIDLLSGIVFLFTAPLIPLFMILIGSLAENLTKKQWKSLSRMSGYFLDILQGLTTLKLFGRSKAQIKAIYRISTDFRLATMKVLKIAFLSALVLEIVATISIAIIAVEIGLRLLYDKMEFAEAMFILILAPEFYAPIRLLGARYHAGMEGLAAARRIFQILDQPLPSAAIGKKKTWDISKATISFNDVSFSYRDGQLPAVHNITIDLASNSKTALVGPSGSGKTTLSHLLLRFIDPDGGRISINGLKLCEIDADAWRSRIAWVPQNPYLFHRSIAENIRLADPNADDERVIKVAQQANIAEFIESLPAGYNTIIGERGARLSGGQAQRIALARAFLKDAPLLILDEPTASMDAHLEEKMLASMEQLMQNRTVLIIAHRLNTVRRADQIIVLDQGCIAENGSHQSLIQRDGLYRRYIRIQEAGA